MVESALCFGTFMADEFHFRFYRKEKATQGHGELSANAATVNDGCHRFCPSIRLMVRGIDPRSVFSSQRVAMLVSLASLLRQESRN